MQSLEPEKNGMEELYNSVQDSFRNFLNSTVGSEMGATMYPGAYKPEAPDNIKAATDWQSVVYDKDGEDTGMRIQVWNGDGSIAETQTCSDIAMALHELSMQRESEGKEVTSTDIGSAIKKLLGTSSRGPVTATELAKASAMLHRMGFEDIKIPPANYSGSAEDFLRYELSLTSLNPALSWSEMMWLYMKYKIMGDDLLGEIDKSIAEDIITEHPEILNLPMDHTLPNRFTALIKQYYPDISDDYIQTLMEIFHIRDPKATEQ